MSPLEIEASFHLFSVRANEGLGIRKGLGALQAHWGFPLAKADTKGGPGDHGIPEIGRAELSYFKHLTTNQREALKDVLAIVDKLFEANGGHWDGVDPWKIGEPLDEWKAATMATLAAEPMKAYLIGQSLATEAAADLARRFGRDGNKMMRPILPEDRRIIDYLTHYTMNEVDSHFEDLKHELRNQLVGGIARGSNPKEVARAIRNISQDYNSDFERIAITETARAESQGRLQELQDQGFSDVIGSSAHDMKTCDHCKRLIDGKVHRISGVADKSNYGRKVDDYLPVIPLHPRCVAAGQRVMTSLGLRVIEDVCVGDFVLTHQGRFRRVDAVASRHHSGIIFDVGGLRVTGNHPVLTSEGFRPAADLGERVDVVGVSRIPWLHAGPNNPFSGEMLGVPSTDCRLVGSTFSPLVSTERVREFAWSGHVYDLQVREDESFVVEGIAVHNCRCVWLPWTVELSRAA